MVKAAFDKNILFTSKWDFNLRTKPVKCHIWSTALYGAKISTVRKVDHKYLESFQMWCWRSVEKIN